MVEQHFIHEVEERLQREGIQFKSQQSIEGLIVDFIIYEPGRQYIVEAKSGKYTHERLLSAVEQAKNYQIATKADRAFVVVPWDTTSKLEGVVTVDGLIDELRRERTKVEPERSHRSRPSSGEPKRIVFCAMPFASEYHDTYFVAMTYAARQVEATATRVDFEDYSDLILNEIERGIRDCAAVIADLSKSNPNVLYEVGYAHALDKPIVHICSSGLDDLPFNVQGWNTMPYTLGQTHNLRMRLATRLRAVLDRQG